MKIKGYQKTSLIDFKPYISSVVFVGGCSFRCGYCYNPDLVINPNKLPDISQEEVFKHLESKKAFIDGVCITGGEPCIYPEVVEFCRQLKNKGFLVKINTNGSRPDVLKELIDKRFVDKVSMDVKSSFDNYNEIAGVEVDKMTILKSIEYIINSGIDHEFNTTPIPGIVDKKEVSKISKMIKGAKKFNLNDFQNDKALIGEELRDVQRFTKPDLEVLKKIASEHVEKVELS